MAQININNSKACAFCKYWYDPINEAIQPVAPNIGVWKYQHGIRKKCLKKNVGMHSTACCQDYICKV